MLSRSGRKGGCTTAVTDNYVCVRCTILFVPVTMQTNSRSASPFPFGVAQSFGKSRQALDFARDDNGGKFTIFKVNIPTLGELRWNNSKVTQ